MKRRNIVYFLCVLMALVLLFVAVKLRLTTAHHYQRVFLDNSDFLTVRTKDTSTFDYYAQAVRIIQDSHMEDSNQPLGVSSIDEVNSNKICSLLIAGARKEHLGDPQIDGFQTSFVVPNYGDLKLSELILLAKVVGQFGRDKIKQGKDVERALYLGKACVAVGIQFSATDHKLVRMVGIAFKKEGHAILKAYAEATGKEKFLELALHLGKEIDKELLIVRRQKDWEPSFWDTFVECSKH